MNNSLFDAKIAETYYFFADAFFFFFDRALFSSAKGG